jgi:hypothetical protein
MTLVGGAGPAFAEGRDAVPAKTPGLSIEEVQAILQEDFHTHHSSRLLTTTSGMRLSPTLLPPPPVVPLATRSRFQPVTVPEPSIDETFEILQGLRERYETHHKLRYTDESLMAAALKKDPPPDTIVEIMLMTELITDICLRIRELENPSA